jgi:dTDP-glucose 4,6-dehydratase
MSMTKSVAVVTGGAGFLGSHLCERLLDDGYRVIALDNFVTGSRRNVEHLLGADFILVEHDVINGLSVDGPVDVVMHFASPASPIDYLNLPVETLKVGAHGTLGALDLAREKGARFMLASTSEAYGDPLVHPQPESYWGNVNPVGPRSVYDEAKRFAEAATMAYRRTFGVDTVVLRIFNTYGPRMRAGDGRAIPAFVSAALDGRPLPVAGTGAQTRSICYVDDLVEGIVRLLHSGHAGPMNLGNPYEITMLDLAREIAALVGAPDEVEFIPRMDDDPEKRRPDITLAQTLLGWEPKVDPAQGLRATVEWFRSMRAETDPARRNVVNLRDVEPAEVLLKAASI